METRAFFKIEESIYINYLEIDYKMQDVIIQRHSEKNFKSVSEEERSTAQIKTFDINESDNNTSKHA